MTRTPIKEAILSTIHTLAVPNPLQIRFPDPERELAFITNSAVSKRIAGLAARMNQSTIATGLHQVVYPKPRLTLLTASRRSQILALHTPRHRRAFIADFGIMAESCELLRAGVAYLLASIPHKVDRARRSDLDDLFPTFGGFEAFQAACVDKEVIDLAVEIRERFFDWNALMRVALDLEIGVGYLSFRV